MKMTVARSLIAAVFQLCLLLAGFSHAAEDALVLPKGVFRTTLDSSFYLPIDKRYDPNGKVESLAKDFNTNLNSGVFSALTPLNPFVGGSASIGDGVTSFKYENKELEIGLQYGVTDSVTVGVKIPYRWFTNQVKARLNSAPGSHANVGKNPCFGVTGCPFGKTVPIVPLSLGGVRLTTEDVQGLLGGGLDINGDGAIDIAGFGFKRFQTWKADGLRDIETGFRYQYLKTQDWRLAFTGGVRFPTGRVDDIDNLADFAFGSGAYALLFRFNHDYVVSNLWKGAPKTPVEGGSGVPGEGDLVLNGTFNYDVVLPDKIRKRISTDPNRPIALNKESVSRDIGDYFQLEGSAKYGLLEGLFFSGTYRYGIKNADSVTGSIGHIAGLEKETRATEHFYIIDLSYSTLPLYAQNKFFLPLTASVSYRNRFAGSNNVVRSQYIGLGLKVFF
jgi:hypothetical protein